MFRNVSVWKVCASVLVLGSLAGCGAGSGDNASPSPFEGSYSGSFTRNVTITGEPAQQSGTESLTVSQGGSITGIVNNTTLGNNNVAITGTIAASGQLSGSVAYPLATYVLSGTLTKAAGSQLNGPLQVSLNGTNLGTETVTLTKH
jgi:hypothetical protein